MRIVYLKVLLLSDSQLAITSAVAQILFNAYSSIKGPYMHEYPCQCLYACMYTNIHDNVRITFFAESAIVFSFSGHIAYRCVLQEGR